MISVVIPCYRSENTIEKVTEKLISVLMQRDEQYEIILVNDGSPDNVWNKIKTLSEKYGDIVCGINFCRNFGQHSALLAGYRYAIGDVVVSMDDDGQTNSEYLWELVDKLREGYDVVYAEYPESKEKLFRRLGSWINAQMCITMIDKPKDVKGTSFNAIRKYIIDDMIRYDNPYQYIGGLVFRTTKNFGKVIVPHEERMEGTSGYSLKKLMALTFNGFTAFSVKPLRVASYVGSVCAIMGFVYGLIVVCRRLFNPMIQMGYSSLMAGMMFVGGMLMLMLGIIGEYVGKTYMETKQRPRYIISERTFK